MAIVQIPIELLALNAQFNKKIKESTASVAQLDAEVKMLNGRVAGTASNKAIKNVGNFDGKIKTLGKTYAVSSKQIQVATDKNQSSTKRLIASVSLLSRSFKVLRNIILPLGLALFAGTRLLNRFRLTTIASILALRVTIETAVVLIKLAFDRLAQSRSIFEFGVNLVRLGRLSSESFGLILDGAAKAGDELSDPSLFKDFIDFATRSAIKVGVLAFALKKLGPFLFGTSSLLKQFARSSIFLGSIVSIGALKVDLFTKSLKTNSKILQIGLNGLKAVTQAGVNFTTGFVRFGNVLERSGSVLVALNRTGLKPLSTFIRRATKNTAQIGKAFSVSAKQTELFSNSLFGSTSRISTLGVGLVGLGVLLKKSENGFIRFLGSVSEFVGLILGPVNLLVSRLLAGIGSLIAAMGSALVSANQKAASSFQKAQLASFTFLRTIKAFGAEFPKVVGTTKQWNEQIEELNKTTGETTANLRFIVAELIETGTSMGLTNKQIKLLTNASVDFAAQLGGDSKQAALDLTSALNGNSQSVQKYGLQLTAASVQQFLFDQGITKTFASMTEQEKIQARLATLTKTYHLVQGIAEAQTKTFAGTTRLLERRMQGLAAIFGEGTNIVENFGIAERLLINIIDELNPLIVKTVGFFSALAGRILQVVGIFFQLIFTVSLAVTSYKALNALLASQAFQRGFFAKIPLFNRSLANMVTTLGVTNLSIKSLGGAMRAVGQIFVAQTKRMVAGILGVEVATISWTVVMNAATAAIRRMTVAMLVFLATPLVAFAVAAAAGLILVFKVFSILEKQTEGISAVFSAIGGVIKDIFGAAIKFLTDNFRFLIVIFARIAPATTIVLSVFALFFATIKTIVSFIPTLFGRVVSGLSNTFSLIARLIAKLPDFIVSADRKMEFKLAAKKLDEFQSKLQLAGFSFEKLGKQGEDAKRGLASVFSVEGLAQLPTNLRSIAQQIQKAGKSELDLLKIQLTTNLNLIVKSLKDQKIAKAQASELSLAVLANFHVKERELELKQREKLRSIAEQFGGAAAIQEKLEADLAQLQLANNAKLLSNQEFELAKTAIEIQADQKRLDAKLNNELLVADLTSKSRVEQLQFQKKILEAELKAQQAAGVVSIAAKRKLNQINKALDKQREADQRSTFATIATLSDSNNSALAAIGKAAALTQIAIDGPIAVTKALAAFPPPFNFAAAAAVGLAVAAQAARVVGIPLASGITSVPPGFNNDSFPARLTSGERVLNVPQNRDFTNFLADQQSGGGDSQKELLGKIVEGIDGLMEIMGMNNEKLDNLENEIVVTIGGRELTREIRQQLRSGRSLAI